MQLALNTDYNLYERNGQAFCDSLQIAETFEKRHDNVLADIRNLDCSLEFTALNFQASKYKDPSGKYNLKYLITKDGFTFLVMGYRGAKAAAFKEAYIKRFNQMETFIKDLLAARMECPELTAAISKLHDDPKHYHYSNELDMLNVIVTGCTAKQMRQLNGLNSGVSIRPYLTPEQITAITQLQRFDAGLVLTVPDYHERKRMLTSYYNARQRISLSA